MEEIVGGLFIVLKQVWCKVPILGWSLALGFMHPLISAIPNWPCCQPVTTIISRSLVVPSARMCSETSEKLVMATVTDCNWTLLPSLLHFLSKLTFKNSVEYGFRLWFAQRAGTISINSSKRSHLDLHMFKKRNWYYWFWGLCYIIVFFLKVPYMNLGFTMCERRY